MLPTEGPSGSRRRRLLRLGWPWLLVAAAAALGGATTGLPGALVLGGGATALYAVAFLRVQVRWTSRPGRVVLVCLTGLMVGMAALLVGGYLGSSAPVETR